MAGFKADLALPEKYERSSGLFKVVIPGILLGMTTAFFITYYKMNGYAPPSWLGKPFIYIFLILPFVLFWFWYHRNHQKLGKNGFVGRQHRF